MVDTRTTDLEAGRRRFWRLAFILPIIGLAVAGCASLRDWWDMQDARYALSFYRIPSTHEETYIRTTEMPAFDGKAIRVVETPALSPADICRIEKIQAGTAISGINVFLDAPGRRLWYTLCRSEREQVLVVVLDQWQRATLRISPADAEKESVFIPGPWSAAEADGLVRFAESNHRKFRPAAN